MGRAVSLLVDFWFECFLTLESPSAHMGPGSGLTLGFGFEQRQNEKNDAK